MYLKYAFLLYLIFEYIFNYFLINMLNKNALLEKKSKTVLIKNVLAK